MENRVSSGDTGTARWNFYENNPVGKGTTSGRGSRPGGSEALIIRWQKSRIREDIVS